MGNKNIVFLISKGLKRQPINIFLARTIMDAIVYFQGYLYEEEKTEDYKLHRIGYLNGTKVEENYCFITGGYEANKKTISEHEKRKQLKIEFEREEEAKKQNNITEQLRVLYNGKIINEQ